jgi:hypothetical protein
MINILIPMNGYNEEFLFIYMFGNPFGLNLMDNCISFSFAYFSPL